MPDTQPCRKVSLSAHHGCTQGMSTSKKARLSSPADDEMKELWGKDGGRVLCDGLANSLKTTRNKTGYRYVYPVGGTYRGTHSFYAQVYDI